MRHLQSAVVMIALCAGTSLFCAVQCKGQGKKGQGTQQLVTAATEVKTVPGGTPGGGTCSSTGEVLDVASKAVMTVQGQMYVVQTTAALLTLLLVVTGFVNFRSIRRHGLQIRQLEEETRRVSDAKATLVAELERMRQAEEDARVLLRVLRTHSEVVKAISELAIEKDGARLRPLQKLSQLVDPMGIPPMMKVLSEPTESVALRREAAYGLGRFAAVSDAEASWHDIIECFREVLKSPRTPQKVIQEVIKSAAKFGGRADELYELVGARA